MRGARRSEAERRVVEAFEGVHAPEALRARTLERIEREREAEKNEGSPAAPAPDEIVPFAPRLVRRRRALRLAAAACLALALVGAGGAYVALTPTAYVDIDVNPSIELAVNRLDGVVGATALNEDGERVLSEVDVVWRGYDDALDAIGDELEEAGYLTSDSLVSVTVACDNDRQYDALKTATHACLGSGAGEVRCDHASEEEHHAAHDVGMGVGKWRVWQELVGSGEDLSANEAQEMSMRELRDLCDDAAGNSSAVTSGGRHHDEGHHRGRGSHE